MICSLRYQCIPENLEMHQQMRVNLFDNFSSPAEFSLLPSFWGGVEPTKNSLHCVCKVLMCNLSEPSSPSSSCEIRSEHASYPGFRPSTVPAVTIDCPSVGLTGLALTIWGSALLIVKPEAVTTWHREESRLSLPPIPFSRPVGPRMQVRIV